MVSLKGLLSSNCLIFFWDNVVDTLFQLKSALAPLEDLIRKSMFNALKKQSQGLSFKSPPARQIGRLH